VVLLATAAACGGASYSAGLPSSSVGDAQRDVDVAESKLGGAIGMGNHADAMKHPSELPPQQQGTAPNAPPDRPSVAPENGNDAPLQEEDRCKTACDALTAMLRAVDRLCDLTGQGDDRCQSARERVQRASERVAEVCPACTTT
jgi:hypothetical protein